LYRAGKKHLGGILGEFNFAPQNILQTAEGSEGSVSTKKRYLKKNIRATIAWEPL
jgi:hypothetical protein